MGSMGYQQLAKTPFKLLKIRPHLMRDPVEDILNDSLMQILQLS
jgi:hypothetical protein